MEDAVDDGHGGEADSDRCHDEPTLAVAVSSDSSPPDGAVFPPPVMMGPPHGDDDDGTASASASAPDPPSSKGISIPPAASSASASASASPASAPAAVASPEVEGGARADDDDGDGGETGGVGVAVAVAEVRRSRVGGSKLSLTNIRRARREREIERERERDEGKSHSPPATTTAMIMCTPDDAGGGGVDVARDDHSADHTSAGTSAHEDTSSGGAPPPRGWEEREGRHLRQMSRKNCDGAVIGRRRGSNDDGNGTMTVTGDPSPTDIRAASHVPTGDGGMEVASSTTATAASTPAAMAGFPAANDVPPKRVLPAECRGEGEWEREEDGGDDDDRGRGLVGSGGVRGEGGPSLLVTNAHLLTAGGGSSDVTSSRDHRTGIVTGPVVDAEHTRAVAEASHPELPPNSPAPAGEGGTEENEDDGGEDDGDDDHDGDPEDLEEGGTEDEVEEEGGGEMERRRRGHHPHSKTTTKTIDERRRENIRHHEAFARSIGLMIPLVPTKGETDKGASAWSSTSTQVGGVKRRRKRPAAVHGRAKRTRCAEGGGGMLYHGGSSWEDDHDHDHRSSSSFPSQPPPSTGEGTTTTSTTKTSTALEELRRKFPHRYRQVGTLHSILSSYVRATEAASASAGAAAKDDSSPMSSVAWDVVTNDAGAGVNRFVPPPIFVTGPGGSGKSSVLNCVLDSLLHHHHQHRPRTQSGSGAAIVRVNVDCATVGNGPGGGGGTNADVGAVWADVLGEVRRGVEEAERWEEEREEEQRRDGEGEHVVAESSAVDRRHSSDGRSRRKGLGDDGSRDDGHDGEERRGDDDVDVGLGGGDGEVDDFTDDDYEEEDEVGRGGDVEDPAIAPEEGEDYDEDAIETQRRRRTTPTATIPPGAGTSANVHHSREGRTGDGAEAAAAGTTAAPLRRGRRRPSRGPPLPVHLRRSSAGNGGFRGTGASAAFAEALMTICGPPPTATAAETEEGRQEGRGGGGRMVVLVLDRAERLLGVTSQSCTFSSTRPDRNAILSQLLLMPRTYRLNLCVIVVTTHALLHLTRVHNAFEPTEFVGSISDAVQPIRVHFDAYHGEKVFREILRQDNVKEQILPNYNSAITKMTQKKHPSSEESSPEDDVRKLLEERAYDAMIDTFVPSVASATRDVGEMIRLCRLLWPEIHRLLLPPRCGDSVGGGGRGDTRMVWKDSIIRDVRPYLTRLVSECLFSPSNTLTSSFDEFKRNASSTSTQQRPRTDQTTLHFPLLPKFLLLAAFLCQYNRSDQDASLYTNQAKGQRRKKSARTAATNEDLTASDAGANRDGRTTKASFPLERMLSVFTSIVGQYGNEWHGYDGYKFVSTIGTNALYAALGQLRDLGLLLPVSAGTPPTIVPPPAMNTNLGSKRSTSSSGGGMVNVPHGGGGGGASSSVSSMGWIALDSSQKYRCTLSGEEAGVIATSVRFPLDTYLIPRS